MLFSRPPCSSFHANSSGTNLPENSCFLLRFAKKMTSGILQHILCSWSNVQCYSYMRCPVAKSHILQSDSPLRLGKLWRKQPDVWSCTTNCLPASLQKTEQRTVTDRKRWESTLRVCLCVLHGQAKAQHFRQKEIWSAGDQTTSQDSYAHQTTASSAKLKALSALINVVGPFRGNKGTKTAVTSEVVECEGQGSERNIACVTRFSITYVLVCCNLQRPGTLRATTLAFPCDQPS